MSTEKTHYRKAFDSPYLSSADIVEPTVLTVRQVTLEEDKTKKTKDVFNTLYFVERELRQGEKLKPMILNATNSKAMKKLSGSPYIDDWKDFQITVYVDKNVRFARDTVEGLRINTSKPVSHELTPALAKAWGHAKAAFIRDGNLDEVLKRFTMSDENQALIKAECAEVAQ